MNGFDGKFDQQKAFILISGRPYWHQHRHYIDTGRKTLTRDEQDLNLRKSWV